MFHAAAFLFYLLLSSIWLHRLFPQWNSAIVGGLQDTRLFIWNGWWFRYAIDVLQQSPFHTSLLFQPYGSTLLSHDYPLWMSVVTYAGQHAGLGLIASLNGWFLLSWVLAGFCTYLLVWEIAHERGPAWVAGLLVMTHSYTLARAMQNWGQFNLWGIALFLWLWMRARHRGRTSDYLVAGVALAWTAACHYYFLIYSGSVWLAVLAIEALPWRAEIERRIGASWRWVFLVLAALGAGVAAWVVVFQPGHLFIGAKMISVKNPTNALLVMWVSLGAWWVFRYKLSFLPKNPPVVFPWRSALALSGSALLFLLPLIWGTVQLILEGGYPKQSILWKTHLNGAHLGALFMPNPLHALWGPHISQWFYERGMQPQEQAAMIGWVCLAVVLWARQRGRWGMLAVSASILSLGTYLHVLEYNTWLPLPFYVWRLLPVLGNVRVPERWMALGAIAWAVLLGLALVTLAKNKRWSINRLCLIVGALVLIENWPGLPLGRPPANHPVFETLRGLPAGGVLPLPLYIGDSSVGTGDAPSGLIWEQLGTQIYHQQPMVGGYLGRISRDLIKKYQADPFIGKLLNIEEEEDLDSHPLTEAITCASLKQLQVSYVLLYPNAIRPTALSFAQQSIPMTLLERTPELELYRVQCK